MSSSGWRLWPLLLAAALLAIGCGGGGAETASGPSATSGDEPDEGGGGRMSALPEGMEAPDFPTRPLSPVDEQAPVSFLLLRPAGAPPPDTREIYARMAPATVIVRAGPSMGTGVVVGPGGLILTNHHVIRPAPMDEGFRMRTTVEFGRLNDTGSMAPDGERRTAHVLKIDQARDLALLRVEEAPATPIVGIAADDPTPGAAVTCIGHGNVGMVWAIRRCDVLATGRMDETLSRLHAACGQESGGPLEEMLCNRMREETRALDSVVVQTSCLLTPGDSGGPIVDENGMLVGVNVLTMRNPLGQHSSFHIHAREVRDFLTSVPNQPIRNLPEPWLESPIHRQVLDMDLDGRWDTLVLRGRDGTQSRLYDLTQSTPDFAVEEAEALADERRFQADMAVVEGPAGIHVWHDTNGDGRFDLLLAVDPREQVTAAYAIAANGDVEQDDSHQGRALLAARVQPAGRARFGRIFDAEALEDDPRPLPAQLRTGQLIDSNRDGVFDTVQGDASFVYAIAFDVDQSSLASARPDTLEELVREGRLDAEVSFIRRGSMVWAYYDRNDDGQMDFGLRTGRHTPAVVAVVPGPGGGATPATEDVLGTLVIRPEFAGGRPDAFRAMVAQHTAPTWIAGPDLGGLPDPFAHHRSPQVVVPEVPRAWRNAVASVQSGGFQSTLVDVNRSSFRGRGRRNLSEGFEAAVRDGHLEANFALASMVGANWAFYDSDLDGSWDIVLARVDDRGEVHQNAFRRGDDGTFRHAADLVQGPLVRADLFPRAQQARFRALAEELFEGGQVAGTGGPATPVEQVHQGRITESHPRLPERNRPYDVYEFNAGVGWTVEIDMMSDELDAYLYLEGPGGQRVAEDDDGGDGFNARIRYRTTVAGRYRVLATTFSAMHRGAYTLRLVARP